MKINKNTVSSNAPHPTVPMYTNSSNKNLNFLALGTTTCESMTPPLGHSRGLYLHSNYDQDYKVLQ